MSKYGVFSGPYFPVFSLNTGRYGSEINPYLETFQAVRVMKILTKAIILTTVMGLLAISIGLIATSLKKLDTDESK